VSEHGLETEVLLYAEISSFNSKLENLRTKTWEYIELHMGGLLNLAQPPISETYIHGLNDYFCPASIITSGSTECSVENSAWVMTQKKWAGLKH
jgi:hypothetical protein